MFDAAFWRACLATSHARALASYFLLAAAGHGPHRYRRGRPLTRRVTVVWVVTVVVTCLAACGAQPSQGDSRQESSDLEPGDAPSLADLQRSPDHCNDKQACAGALYYAGDGSAEFWLSWHENTTLQVLAERVAGELTFHLDGGSGDASHIGPGYHSVRFEDVSVGTHQYVLLNCDSEARCSESSLDIVVGLPAIEYRGDGGNAFSLSWEQPSSEHGEQAQLVELVPDNGQENTATGELSVHAEDGRHTLSMTNVERGFHTYRLKRCDADANCEHFDRTVYVGAPCATGSDCVGTERCGPTGHCAAPQEFQDYWAQCRQALELGDVQVPGFACTDGVPLKAEQTAKLLLQENAASFVGKLAIPAKPEVDAVFLCRGHDPRTDSFDSAGVILHHRLNGATCFVDAAQTESRDGEEDAPNTLSSLDALEPNWAAPHQAEGNCGHCHSNDPFIISPGLVEAAAELDLLYTRNALGPYRIVGSDDPSSYYYGWDRYLEWESPSCAEAAGCHRTSSSGQLKSYQTAALGESPWMGPCEHAEETPAYLPPWGCD